MSQIHKEINGKIEYCVTYNIYIPKEGKKTCELFDGSKKNNAPKKINVVKLNAARCICFIITGLYMNSYTKERFLITNILLAMRNKK